MGAGLSAMIHLSPVSVALKLKLLLLLVVNALFGFELPCLGGRSLPALAKGVAKG